MSSMDNELKLDIDTGAPPETEEVSTPSSGLYTCFIHPDVTLDEPGACLTCGFTLEHRHIPAEATTHVELMDMTQRYWVSAILIVPMFLLTVPFLARYTESLPSTLVSTLQFMFATPMIFWCDLPLLKRGWDSISNLKFNMYTLIALSVVTAYSFSVIGLISKFLPAGFHINEMHLYFKTTAVIILLALMNQVLELLIRKKINNTLRHLLSFIPESARRKFTKLIEKDIPTRKVAISDVLHVLPEQRVPVDGLVIDGHSTVDESVITGTALPKDKLKGSYVMGGSLNLLGNLVMRAKRVSHASILSQVIEHASEAQRSRAPIQQYADCISEYFVPVVMGIAFLTFLIWAYVGTTFGVEHGIISAICVLIMACPCAIYLATPLAMMIGMGAGAEKGIVIKNAEYLQRFEKINTLIISDRGFISNLDEVTTINAIQALNNEGIRTVLLTQDSKEIAEATAKKLGIEIFHAEISSQDKAQVVTSLRAEGSVVALIGDQFNDGAALAAADISILMTGVTEIDMRDAHICIVRDNLWSVVNIRLLSEKVMSNIRQNLSLAVFYNVISIPVAAGILYPLTGAIVSPMIGAVGMCLCSAAIMLNALRLKRDVS